MSPRAADGFAIHLIIGRETQAPIYGGCTLGGGTQQAPIHGDGHCGTLNPVLQGSESAGSVCLFVNGGFLISAIELDPILRIHEVVALVGLSKATIYAMIAKGTFPKPVRLNERAVGWRTSDIRDWLKTRPTATDRNWR